MKNAETLQKLLTKLDKKSDWRIADIVGVLRIIAKAIGKTDSEITLADLAAAEVFDDEQLAQLCLLLAKKLEAKSKEYEEKQTGLSRKDLLKAVDALVAKGEDMPLALSAINRALGQLALDEEGHESSLSPTIVSLILESPTLAIFLDKCERQRVLVYAHSWRRKEVEHKSPYITLSAFEKAMVLQEFGYALLKTDRLQITQPVQKDWEEIIVQKYVRRKIHGLGASRYQTLHRIVQYCVKGK